MGENPVKISYPLNLSKYFCTVADRKENKATSQGNTVDGNSTMWQVTCSLTLTKRPSGPLDVASSTIEDTVTLLADGKTQSKSLFVNPDAGLTVQYNVASTEGEELAFTSHNTKNRNEEEFDQSVYSLAAGSKSGAKLNVLIDYEQ